MFIRFRRPDPLELLVDLSVEIETSVVKVEWGLLGRGKPEEVRERLITLAEEAFAAMERGILDEAYAKQLKARIKQALTS